MNIAEPNHVSKQLGENGLVFDFARAHPQDFGRVISSYDTEVAVQVLQLLPRDTLVLVVAHVSQQVATSIFESLEIEELAKLVNSASTDVASRVAYRLSATQRPKLLGLLNDPRRKRVLSKFLDLDANTVGMMADKDFLWFPSSMSVEQVRTAFRSAEDRNALESALVLNDDESVRGLLDHIGLTQAEDSDRVGNCVEHTVLVPARARPHAVVYFDDWHRVNRLPVVDQELKPIGVLRWSQLAELADSSSVEEELESFSIVYEIPDTMVELGRSLLTLPSRR